MVHMILQSLVLTHYQHVTDRQTDTLPRPTAKSLSSTAERDRNQVLIQKKLTFVLQSVQNMAARMRRIVSGVRRSEHITPVLEDLHWLPVSQRVVFKTALMV